MYDALPFYLEGNVKSAKSVEVGWVERLALLELAERWGVTEEEALQRMLRQTAVRELLGHGVESDRCPELQSEGEGAA
jgi:hypothetical protein